MTPNTLSPLHRAQLDLRRWQTRALPAQPLRVACEEQVEAVRERVRQEMQDTLNRRHWLAQARRFDDQAPVSAWGAL